MEEKKNKQTENIEKLIESPEALQDTLGTAEKFAEKNKNLIMAAMAGFAVFVLAVFGYVKFQDSKNMEGQEVLSPSVFFLEKGEYQKALEGDGNSKGFVRIADEFSGTAAANLASYYAGVAYLNTGEFDQAIAYLEDFSSNDLLVQARAFALLGDAYVEKENYEKAASYFEKAASYKENKAFAPTYLYKKALAEEAAGNANAAVETYQEIASDYETSQEAIEAKKSIARLSVK
ncbi:tetratricopeptide repeat protein [Algivirga pacifica]